MATWPSRAWASSSVPPAASTPVPRLCRSMWGWTCRSSPARRDRAASSSLSAPGRIGAPTGSRNKLTSTKSQSRAGRHAWRSTAYWSKASTSRESTGTARARRDLASAPLGFSRRRTWRCSPSTVQPRWRASTTRWRSSRRRPHSSPSAQPRPRQAADDQPVPRRPAGPKQRQDLLVGGGLHRLVRLAQAMAGLGPVAHLVALAAHLGRQVADVADPVELAEHLRGHGADVYAVAQE